MINFLFPIQFFIFEKPFWFWDLMSRVKLDYETFFVKQKPLPLGASEDNS